jgi:hypothetical protein
MGAQRYPRNFKHSTALKPFTGIKNDRNVTHEELIRVIRFMIAAEYEAVNYISEWRSRSRSRCLLRKASSANINAVMSS